MQFFRKVKKVIFIIGLFVTFILLFIFLKPLIDWLTNKECPFADRDKILFKESKYYNDFNNTFRDVCTKGNIDYDKLNIYILLNNSNQNLIYVNAAAWQTIRTKDNVFMEEGAFIYFDGYPDLVKAIFSHEIGHIRKNDSFWKHLISEYSPFVIPIVFYAILIIILFNLDYLARATPYPYNVIIFLFELLLGFMLFPLLILLFLTSWIIPVWHFQITEIRADSFAAKVCEKEQVDLLLSALEENELNFYYNLGIIDRLRYIYIAKLHEHPSMTFRRKILGNAGKIGFFFKIGHYFRLLLWLLTGRGFYGEYFFLKAR